MALAQRCWPSPTTSPPVSNGALMTSRIEPSASTRARNGSRLRTHTPVASAQIEPSCPVPIPGTVTAVLSVTGSTRSKSLPAVTHTPLPPALTQFGASISASAVTAPEVVSTRTTRSADSQTTYTTSADAPRSLQATGSGIGSPIAFVVSSIPRRLSPAPARTQIRPPAPTSLPWTAIFPAATGSAIALVRGSTPTRSPLSHAHTAVAPAPIPSHGCASVSWTRISAVMAPVVVSIRSTKPSGRFSQIAPNPAASQSGSLFTLTSAGSNEVYGSAGGGVAGRAPQAPTSSNATTTATRSMIAGMLRSLGFLGRIYGDVSGPRRQGATGPSGLGLAASSQWEGEPQHAEDEDRADRRHDSRRATVDDVDDEVHRACDADRGAGEPRDDQLVRVEQHLLLD